MPRQSKAQQAVAIALREAGASKNESPKKNRRTLSKTKSKERRGRTAQTRGRKAPVRRGRPASGGVTRAALLQQARRKGIPGRSGMSKAQLQRALQSKARPQRTQRTRKRRR